MLLLKNTDDIIGQVDYRDILVLDKTVFVFPREYPCIEHIAKDLVFFSCLGLPEPAMLQKLYSFVRDRSSIGRKRVVFTLLLQ